MGTSKRKGAGEENRKRITGESVKRNLRAILAKSEEKSVLEWGSCCHCHAGLLCDPMDCSPPGSSVHGDSPGKNTGVGCHAFLQGIFPTPGSNSGLPHCRPILYHLSHKGVESPLNYVAVVFLENSGHMKTI